MNKTIIIVGLGAALLNPRVASTQTAAAPPCGSDSAYHALDFWIGAWRVTDSTGAVVGHNRIESILGGCAIMENWTEPDGSEGKSLFYYNPQSRQWKQVWITPNALAPGGMKEKHLIATYSRGGVRFQGEIVGPAGRTILDRTTLTLLEDGRVRQVIEISRDGGSRWIANFDAVYTREPPKK